MKNLSQWKSTPMLPPQTEMLPEAMLGHNGNGDWTQEDLNHMLVGLDDERKKLAALQEAESDSIVTISLWEMLIQKVKEDLGNEKS
jgi:hypothetical protein